MAAHQATTTMAETNQAPRASLLTIPPEIRLEIYELVLADFDIYFPWNSRYPSLLRVCKLMRLESVGIFNKRISAILSKEEAMIKIEVAEVAKLEKEYDQSLDKTIEDYLNILDARDNRDVLKEDYEGAQRLAEGEREKLREEGFRV